MSLIGQDVLHGARLFVKQPAYALAAVVTLALAIGANTLIFTMANVLVLKPLPIREPERLAWIFATGPDVISWRGPISLPEYVTYRDGAPAYSTLSAYQRRTFTMNADGTAERVLGQVVIGDLHALWGLTAIRGRTLTVADERPGAPGVAVLSHRFWSTRFGGSMDIIGRDIRLDGQHRTLVGVLTPDIELGNISEIDVWLPYQGDATQASRTDRSWRSMGRLAGGATIDSAHAQVTALAARMASEHSDTDRDRSARVGPTKDALGTPNTWIVLSMLVTVVGLLLVLACANVMNLLIARLIARRQELAMRTALGGSRGRIVTQIVSESLVLGLAGGALGPSRCLGRPCGRANHGIRAVLPSACVRRSSRRIRRHSGFCGAARLLDRPHASHASRRPSHSSQRRHDAQHRQPKHRSRPVGAGRAAGHPGRHTPRRGSAHREIDADDDSDRYRLRGLGLAVDAHRNPDMENR